MAKSKRRWIELNFSNPDALRAQDIPYSATLNVKEAIDQAHHNFTDYPGADPLPVIGVDVVPATLLWDRQREALLAGVTGLAWIQVSAGSSQGPTGLGGGGNANFIQDGYPPLTQDPVFLWNQADEALFVGVTGINHWVQIGAGGSGGGSGNVTGDGTLNYLAKWTDTSSLGSSIVYSNSNMVIVDPPVVNPTDGPLVKVNGILSVGDGSDNLYNQGILQVINQDNEPQQIAINVGNTDATETFNSITYQGGFYPLREGQFARSIHTPVYTREDHGVLDASGFLPIVGSFYPSDAQHYDLNYNGTGYVVINNGREHPEGGNWYPIRASVEFTFDTFYTTTFDTTLSNVILRDNGFPNSIFSNEDIDGYFCITVPDVEGIHSRRALTLINNTPYQLDVAYWVKFTETLDPYVYLGWLYD